MTDDDYLSALVSMICILAFAVGATMILQHPDWFNGTMP